MILSLGIRTTWTTLSWTTEKSSHSTSYQCCLLQVYLPISPCVFHRLMLNLVKNPSVSPVSIFESLFLMAKNAPRQHTRLLATSSWDSNYGFSKKMFEIYNENQRNVKVYYKMTCC